MCDARLNHVFVHESFEPGNERQGSSFARGGSDDRSPLTHDVSGTRRLALRTLRARECCQALKVLEMEPPIQSSSIAWRCIYEVPLSCPAAGASSPWTVSIKFWADNKVWFRVSVVSGGATTNWKPEGMASTVGEGQWELYQAGTAVRTGFTFKPVGAATSGEAKEGTENAGADEVALRQDAKACVLEFKSGGWTKGVSVFYAIDVTP